MPDWLERLVIVVARRAAEEAVHTQRDDRVVDDDDEAKDVLDADTALRHFYADYLGRLDHLDPVADAESERRDLVVALALTAAAPRLLADTVHRLRTVNGWSWTDIAAVAGTTRQAAAQRWGSPAR
ncbi:hypothetical protein SAMN05660209_03294 [Geodermatophilus africanus]|uniref:Sigma-70, region 4 n=1 Tax=Geodermatophilus africanus TaxID=1137993 RepID=A0A1H3LDT5_9ACTN|nr:hypothetical protein [Geodermatophilus africanus]SDY62319.1 hypothetical protein SAMN05660209_03294 [Geodermatophilus africanus]